MPTWKEKLPDGRTIWHVNVDEAMAVAMLGDRDDQPKLTQEQFEELSDEMKKVREEAETDGGAGA